MHPRSASRACCLAEEIWEPTNHPRSVRLFNVGLLKPGIYLVEHSVARFPDQDLAEPADRAAASAFPAIVEEGNPAVHSPPNEPYRGTHD
jgi:hypothetical protein